MGDSVSKDSEKLIKQIIENSQTHSLFDSIDKKVQEVEEIAQVSIPIRDGYRNSLLGIGDGNQIESFTSYGLDTNTLNWMLWTVLYSDSWVFKRAIDKPAQDEVRCGIRLIGNDPKIELIYKLLNKYRSDLIQLLQWGALYGGAIGVLMFDNVRDEEYAQPMNIEKLKLSKSMKMYVVDRWYGVSCTTNDLVDDMKSLDFGKPKYYEVTLGDGNRIKFHHDYVLRYEHRFAPKLIKNGMLQGWGYAEGSHILNELTRDDKLKASIQSLVDKSLIEVIKMSGMRGVFMGADEDNEQQLRKRLEMVEWARNFNSLTFLDKEDEYQQNTFSGLSGLSELLQNNMWLISSALEMQGVLFGDLKSGFSNDENALERYNETINNRCENYYRPILTKLITLFYKLYDIEDPLEFTFNSLLVDKEEKERLEGINAFVELLSKMLGDGVIDTSQYAQAAQTYVSRGVIDFGITEENINKLKENLEEEIEDIKI